MLDFLNETSFDELKHSSFRLRLKVSELAILILELLNGGFEILGVFVLEGVDVQVLVDLIDLDQGDQLLTLIFDAVEGVVEFIFDQSKVLLVKKVVTDKVLKFDILILIFLLVLINLHIELKGWVMNEVLVLLTQ